MNRNCRDSLRSFFLGTTVILVSVGLIFLLSNRHETLIGHENRLL